MKSSHTILLVVIVVVVAVVFFLKMGDKQSTEDFSRNSAPTTAEEQKNVPAPDTSVDSPGAVAEPTAAQPEAQMTKEEDKMKSEMKSDEMAKSGPGTYAPYTAEALANNTAEKTVLTFHAPWCPSCRALDTDITNNLSKIPSGVAIYKVDYDTATELKKKYGITTQHSVIEIDKNGEKISGVSRPFTLDGLVATLK